ncbi:Hsp20/alpha crystallin family protein [Stackebrandtia nassauensis]|uniref:Heat shock protein Hsp20 n=1 Tax=Stackebrandtia nassauensis (strain DSM 44728 / CIP 108903 / NRRL B-16338 / NBRC 102104 / LLR-40K-21) TaxID=446470 RepID=D3PVI5_STANL|nr:Hsp20/alpha crystallin family protein [Stackebrandtia nassauensis]ADD43099.1 heat shock protein Hsp20 [Stackebrandtia nassauensis DSM 44728]
MTSLTPRIFGDLADFFGMSPGSHHTPPIRIAIQQSDQEYRVRAELPGMDPNKDIHVSVDHDVLSLRAERQSGTHDETHSEFRYGSMYRAVRLPGNADTDNIKAEYVRGVLDITVPLKAGSDTSVVIPVKGS